MSGRARHLRDGHWITNRKTDRRNPRRDPRDKLKELAGAHGDDWPVRMVFRLPKTLEGFVAPGPHGLGITVLGRGYVRIGSDASERCFAKAREFCAVVAKDRPAFTSYAVLSATKEPGRSFGRWLIVMKGSMAVASGLDEPKVYEAA
jgi:hypothetical protein